MIGVLIKAAISAVLLWFLIKDLDLAELTRQMLSVEAGPLAAAVILASIALLFAPALRWSSILRAISHPMALRTTFPLLVISQFFSQVLPSSIGGDAARIWLAHRAGLSGAASVSSVMIDRALGMLSLCLIITAMLPSLHRLAPHSTVWSGLFLLLISAYFGLVLTMLLDRLPESFQRFRLIRLLCGLSADLRSVLLVPRPLLSTLASSLVAHSAQVLMVVALSQGLGLAISVAACFAIVPIISLTTLLPISIAGWGVRESAFVIGFGFLGITAPDAIAVSILLGLINVLVSLPGGLVWLLTRGNGARTSGTPS